MAERPDTILEEQRIYARWLAVGVAVGFGSLVVSFFLYTSGIVPPGIPPEALPRYWSLPVHEYVAVTGAPTGWSWLRRLGEGDLLNFAGVAILGATTVACYLRMVPVLVKSRERVLLAICLAELAVLAAAASGLLFSTH
jgi:hypothetical protein